MAEIDPDRLAAALEDHLFYNGLRITEGSNEIVLDHSRWLLVLLCGADARARTRGVGGCRLHLATQEGSSNTYTITRIETPDPVPFLASLLSLVDDASHGSGTLDLKAIEALELGTP